MGSKTRDVDDIDIDIGFYKRLVLTQGGHWSRIKSIVINTPDIYMYVFE